MTKDREPDPPEVRPPEPLPPTFEATRAALHKVAEQIVAPARKPDNEISLRATPGGFGTPYFEHDGSEQQVRVAGAELVRSVDGEEKRAPLDSLQTAGELVVDLLPPDAKLDDTPLDVDEVAALALGNWYAFGKSVLEQLRADATPGDDVSVVSLWPEHFDIAIELGPEKTGKRANYGFSPGDEDHDQPYLYVGPWSGEVSGELWNGKGFTGAELDYFELVAAKDQRTLALEFCTTRKEAL